MAAPRSLPLWFAATICLLGLSWCLGLEQTWPSPDGPVVKIYPSDASQRESDGELEWSRPGFREHRNTLPPDQEILVEMLEPLEPTVEFEVQGPEHYTVRSGPKDWSSPEKLQLRPGRHLLVVEAEGYLPDSETVELAAGQTRKVTMKLKPIPKPSPTPRPRQVTPPPPTAPPAPAAPPARRPRPRPQQRPRWQRPPAPAPPRLRPTPVPRPTMAPVPRPQFTPVPNP